MARPLFLTGMARGGTNLQARMLIAGGSCRIAIHAFQPWFKSLRNAIIDRQASAGIPGKFDPTAPFGDGHFDAVQSAVQDILHGAGIDVPFATDEWPDLLARLQARAAHDAADLCPKLERLGGAPDYRRMMDGILALVLEGHEKGCAYAGLIDTWIIDLFPALARAYPDARFIVVIRDPRAVVASQLKFLDTMPEEVGHVLSIIRQWRKYLAVAHEYQNDRLFAGRFKFVRYEDQVTDPERFGRELCQFLDLPYDRDMTDLEGYDGQGHRRWGGNSAFESALKTIDRRAMQWWRDFLTPDAIDAVEFCCGRDMEACGYQRAAASNGHDAEAAARAFLAEDDRRQAAWRTVEGEPALEFEHERSRQRLLAAGGAADERDVKLSFLSRRYFDLLQSGARLFADTKAVPA